MRPPLCDPADPQAHEQTEEVKLEAVQDNNVELVTEILGDISSLKVKDDSAAELSRILQEPHFQVSFVFRWESGAQNINTSRDFKMTVPYESCHFKKETFELQT